jgi:hypothetical protein
VQSLCAPLLNCVVQPAFNGTQFCPRNISPLTCNQKRQVCDYPSPELWQSGKRRWCFPSGQSLRHYIARAHIGVIQRLANFQNACGNRHKTLLTIPDSISGVSILNYGLTYVSGKLATASAGAAQNATELAGQIGKSSGASSGEVLSTWGGTEATTSVAVSVAQDVSLVGRIAGQAGAALSILGKASGAVFLAAGVTSVLTREGCALGVW